MNKSSKFTQPAYPKNLVANYQKGHGSILPLAFFDWLLLIDFPQVTDSAGNTQAHFILARDVTRVCEYFSRQGVRCDLQGLTGQLWERYSPIDEHDRLADWSMTEVDEE